MKDLSAFKTFDIRVIPDHIGDEAMILQKLLKLLKRPLKKHEKFQLKRRSIDARKKPVKYVLSYVLVDSNKLTKEYPISYIGKNGRSVVVVGAGPAGYFGGLELLKLGIKPIIIDRGKDVRSRRRDLRAIQQEGRVNPDSNYCFGEGGAGTYSDGKLYTRSHKRGRIKSVLETLVDHGANTDILIDAHPHIGSNRLPPIISNIRETIEKNGGQVHFNSRVDDFIISDGKILGVRCETRDFLGDGVILATGHSARDIYELIHKYGLRIEKKPFAIGVRVEHPQPMIDEAQYGISPRGDKLPAATYKLRHQYEGRGVFSFCMCPGGLIVPAATAPNELVVNGMSLSRRDSPYANSGIVTEITVEDSDHLGYKGPFGHIELQKELERTLFLHGDGSQAAPCQRINDFISGNISQELNETSYIPGVYSAPLHKIFPPWLYERLKAGLINFGKKIKGYESSSGQVIGLESRTSSPIRIPRDDLNLSHPDLDGFFPCGEGAGYAGGILSAAMDGQKVARAVSQYLTTHG